ncbi:MAG: ATP-binding cassette domain-containing protein [Phycisphaerales bacterium]|nr:MAG: ATP-binding cassette domain-containing protein [Phycisphaerales bacterium]
MSQQPVMQRESPGVRFARLLRPYTLRLALTLMLLCLLTLVDMAQPFALKLLIDDVFMPATSAAIEATSPADGADPGASNPGEVAAGETAGGGGNWGLLWLILPGLGVIYVARNALFYSSRMVSLGVSEDLCFNLRKRLFEHLQQLSLRFYRSHQPGKISSRLMDDSFKIQTFIQEKLPTFLRYLLEFQVLVVILYVVNWRLALASTFLLPLHFLVYRVFRVRIRRSHSEAQENLAVAHGNVVEKFLGAEVVKGFSGEERESLEFRRAIDASRQSQIRSQRYHFIQKVAADLLVGLGTVALLGYGAWEVGRGQMKPGVFLMFFIYVKMLYPAVLEVISGLGHLSKAGASVDRVFEMLQEPVDELTVSGATTIELTELQGRLRFQDVCFSYEDGLGVLNHVDLEINPGERVVITGPSGSGKSTLISLLPRFNDPTSGKVLIDDRHVASVPLPDLRGLFGVVFQEVFLFDASVEENLRYARSEATLAEVVEACKITGAHEFIERLPDGYYTRLGASGGELSRGEKQRLTLARALIKDPRILILDEATASIDAGAAYEIINKILEMMEGRTIIMVTHDAELLGFADRVISIEAGRLAYDGPPEQFTGLMTSSSSPLSRRDSPRREVLVGDPDLAGSAAGDRMPASSTEFKPAEDAESKSRVSRATGLAVLACSLLLLGGCLRSSRVEHSLELEDPRISQGVFLEEEDPDRLVQLAEALDALTLEPPAGSLPGVPVQSEEAPAPSAEQEPVAAEAPPVLDVVGEYAITHSPPNSSRLLDLPKLSDTELTELIDRLVLKLGAENGYVHGGVALADTLPPPPRGVVPLRVIWRSDESGRSILRFGYRSYLSQPPQLWLQGLTIAGENVAANADLDAVGAALQPLVASLNEMRAGLTPRDLESKLIQLSYTDATNALAALKSLGVTTISDANAVPQAVDFAQLPLAVKLPDPKKEEAGLIGQGTAAGGTFGLSLTPSVAAALPENTIASPMSQLLVMFHPAHPEQFSRVRKLLDDYIDRPARQIFIEGMVLEISEDGLKDLGIEWELQSGPITFRAGSSEAGGVEDTLFFESTDLDFWRVFTRDFQPPWTGRIRALIRDGKAEILARPSILTLNNRQSTIRVGTDIPIATSTEGTLGSNRIVFNFQYLPTGILLNIRPRINEEGSEVSMLIDTVVSAEVAGAALELRDNQGDIVATAPTVSTRRVQTYARIRNNTPFIVGGLVSRERTSTQDKIPLLGDIPLLGALFRAEKVETTKREVIIVLTPYVLPEDQYIARSLPKDEDAFDSFGNELFRDSYRIRTEDVYDLTFLLENRRLNAYRDLARQAIERNFRLAETEPFSAFAGDHIPGEEMLVTRMIYEVVKRLEVDRKIGPNRLIFFESQQVGGYDVQFLERTMAKLGHGIKYQAFFNNNKGKALAITFHYDRDSMDPNRLASEPIPELTIVDCPDRVAWGELLWEMNQPLEDGRQRFTILLHSDGDMIRLRRAIALKRIVLLNGGQSQLLLRNFSVGGVLLMPDIKVQQAHVIDADVARYFFHTEHYYAAAVQEIEDRLTELDATLREMMPASATDDNGAMQETPPPAVEPAANPQGPAI